MKNNLFRNYKSNSPFITFLLVFVVFLTVVSFIGYDLIFKKIEDDIRAKEETSSLILNRSVENFIGQIRSDITFLNNQIELFYIYESSDFERHLNETFYQFSISKKFYDQIRFIDQTGMEKVRINYNNSEPELVPVEELQDKSDRYYFKDIFELGRGGIYFSVFDLNIENNAVEIPYKPVLRIGAPVFDANQNKIGIVIVNFNGNYLLDLIKNENRLMLGYIFLLNSEGYYFLGQTPEDEWGFMFPEKKDRTFFNDFSEASKQVCNSTEGTLKTKNGLFVYSTIGPMTQLSTSDLANRQEIEVKNSFWKIVSYVPKEEFRKVTFGLIKPWIKVLALFSVLIVVLLWYLSRNIELRRLAKQSLIQRNKELDELVKTKDKFFSIIAHDLRSPFNSILGFSELLFKNRDEISDDEVKDISEMLYSTSNKTYTLLENLLEWSRIQTGTLKPNPERFYLDKCVGEIGSLLMENAKKKNIDLEINSDKEIEVFADREMIKAVLRNLLSNALKFTPHEGQVIIAVKEKPELAEISVTDSGVGISEDDIQEILRSGPVKSKHGTDDEKGTGLGLILCKEFVEKNGGAFRVESILGKGSTFSFTVPLAKSE